MKIIADTHCHTIASSHAYSTILENINEAVKQDLYAIAITDHASNMPSPPGKWYFENLRILPRNINGVNILKGVEANVLNSDGNIDMPFIDKDGFKLDWVIASIHEVAFSGDTDIDSCTETWMNVAKNPLVNVIGHSGLSNFVYDYEKVIPEFGRNGKLVEINNSSFNVRPGSTQNCKKIANLCKKHGVRIVVNSDAHFCMQVGKFDKALKLLEEIDFPEELVVNANKDRFKSYLEEYTCFFKNM
jgi:putative hydrolase